MKIISKFKDFYDFKVTKYGVDEKFVYNRITVIYKNFPKKYSRNKVQEKYNNKILFIGEKVVHIFESENKLYTQFDLKDLEDLKENRFLMRGGNFFYYGRSKNLTFLDGNTIDIKSTYDADLYEILEMDRKTFYNYFIKKISRFNGKEEDFFSKDEKNNFFNEPIVLIEHLENGVDNEKRRGISVYKKTYNPNLQILGLYFNPDFIWQSLVEFLSIKRGEKEIMPVISDENKILSKGFDLKTSFRPNMKKKNN